MIFCCGSNSSTSSKSMGKRLRRWLKYISKAGISIEETTSGHFICQIFPSGGTPCHLLPLSQPVRGARQDAWFYSNNVRWTEGVALKCSCCCCLGLTHYSWCWWWLSETEAKTEQWMVNGHILKTTSRSHSYGYGYLYSSIIIVSVFGQEPDLCPEDLLPFFFLCLGSSPEVGHRRDGLIKGVLEE